MGARLRHLAISSENYAALARFYQAAFGMKASHSNRPEGAVSLSDGYVGMNFNVRRVGGWGRLDHFGFEIDSVEELEDRLRDAYPRVHLLKRLSIRPFAGFTMHDPAGNYFDLSAPTMENRRDVYAEAPKPHARRIHHLTLRAMEPELLCSFYHGVFDLAEQPKAPDDPNHYLSDGQVTLVITPWQIEDYAGGNIEAPGPDHLGFAVESLEQFAADLEHIKLRNPRLHPMQLGYGPEGETRLRLFQTCQYGQQHLADPDGVLLDVVQV
jgi:catechol 2,3-dioxygenase-like lactoylglutathione lyase family enzyme